ncbi:complexed with Cdc5 protein Cwf25 [Schizosaccharomyces cryophilus OY26]|uniref:Complexed with Cdc5 protein Cwf25 n=1 Tax=Schizosaccharomyces cryophilus (strain OY26 / ATCC MYA-4695 / CBS 11777 / NBRC 106824 / NRRL Y48691) TaxID=653667 RepID=S9VTQ3_SCHCR|nr:complexed with Cdc5 protein Cwf25 [Schizosaccharomyces cryophilus OY26]EPY49435.1 complexed with Cdc5 protein Cwf25 [Schizosaccharomyces cryophilus OY26]
MGGGDLNMKKSWHPLLMRNQERVWKEEQTHKEELKRVEQLRREIEEERQLLELQRLQEAAGGKKRKDHVEWMYAVPTAEGPKRDSSEMEEFLLGKRRLDDLLSDKVEDQKNSLNKTEFISLQNANSVQDTQAKVRLDPLLAIKQQEQKQMQLLAEKRKRKLEEEERRKKESERRSRHLNSQERSYDRHGRHSESRRRSYARDVTRRDEYSPTAYGDRHYRDKRYVDDRDYEKRRFYQDKRKYDNERYSRRQFSSRSPSPQRRSFHRPRAFVDGSSKEDARERRLKEMQDNAQKLEKNRVEKLHKLEQEELVESAKNEEERSKTARKWNNQGEFLREMKREVYSGDAVNLADRVSSMRHTALKQ